jgi:hypothetical protein
VLVSTFYRSCLTSWVTHRLLAHKSYTVPRYIRFLLSVASVGAWAGSPFAWVAKHRMHHKVLLPTHAPLLHHYHVRYCSTTLFYRQLSPFSIASSLSDLLAATESHRVEESSPPFRLPWNILSC